MRYQYSLFEDWFFIKSLICGWFLSLSQVACNKLPTILDVLKLLQLLPESINSYIAIFMFAISLFKDSICSPLSSIMATILSSELFNCYYYTLGNRKKESLLFYTKCTKFHGEFLFSSALSSFLPILFWSFLFCVQGILHALFSSRNTGCTPPSNQRLRRHFSLLYRENSTNRIQSIN